MYTNRINNGDEFSPELYNNLSDNACNTTEDVHPMYNTLHYWHEWLSLVTSGGYLTVASNNFNIKGSFVGSGNFQVNDFISLPSQYIGKNLRLRFTVSKTGSDFTIAKYKYTVGVTGNIIVSTETTMSLGTSEIITPAFTPEEACCLVLEFSQISFNSASNNISISKVFLEEVAP